jgi:hypothetical protein
MAEVANVRGQNDVALGAVQSQAPAGQFCDHHTSVVKLLQYAIAFDVVCAHG